jgi:hypothetical protein
MLLGTTSPAPSRAGARVKMLPWATEKKSVEIGSQTS